MSYEDKKLKEINKIVSDSLLSLSRFYNSKLHTELLYNSVAEFIANLSEWDFKRLTETSANIDILSLNDKRKFLRVFNQVSNYLYASLTGIWDNSFELGVKHTIGDVLFNLTMFKKVHFSFGDKLEVAEFTDKKKNNSKKKSEDIGDFIRYINRYGKRVLESLGLSEYRKLNEINNKQKIKYFEAIEDISNVARKARAKQANYLGSNYITSRKRVLSVDYARKYDTSVKSAVKSFLTKESSLIKFMRGSTTNIKELESKIKQNLVAKNFQTLVQDKTKAARSILRTELVLAYNFGKLAGFSSPQDRHRQMKWNADWELQAKIPGYTVCSYCRDMHGRVFTVDYLLRIGSMSDIGVLQYKGTEHTKTSFKNPRLPMIPFHVNCGCFWTIVPESEAKQNVTQTIGKQLEDNLPYILGTGLIVTGGFLLSRSNAFKSFIRTGGDDLLDSILGSTSAPRPKPNPSGNILNENIAIQQNYPSVSSVSSIIDNVTEEIIEQATEVPVYKTIPRQNDIPEVSNIIDEDIIKPGFNPNVDNGIIKVTPPPLVNYVDTLTGYPQLDEVNQIAVGNKAIDNIQNTTELIEEYFPEALETFKQTTKDIVTEG